MKILLGSIDMEPVKFNDRERWLLLARTLPLVENNFNLCELGPRSTRKSHIYKEISPNIILVSGGQTTVANLFYNMGRKTVRTGIGSETKAKESTNMAFNYLKANANRISGIDPYNDERLHLLRTCGQFRQN